MFSIEIAFLVFLLYFLLDIIWVYYTLQVTQFNSIKAGISACLIYGISVLGVLIYTENHWYIPFILLGAFLGTYVTVEKEKRKNVNKKK